MTTRNIERELFIDAEPDLVFAAFTEAEHIMRWFAPFARSAPGVGGFINLSWEEESFNKDCEIVEWEPGQRVVMNWYAGPDGETCLPVAVDLLAKDGGTLLRLVHSGFLSDASWDDEFESHGRGWSYELRSLRFYLERQFGRARSHVMRRLKVSGDLAAAWDALLGERGVFAFAAEDDAAQFRDGARGELRLATGEKAFAEVLYALADKDFAVITEILEGGVFRFALETFAGQPEIWVWAFSWQLAEAELQARVATWFDQLQQRLEAGEDRVSVPAS